MVAAVWATLLWEVCFVGAAISFGGAGLIRLLSQINISFMEEQGPMLLTFYVHNLRMLVIR
jgi:hypothetical protein